MKRLYAADLFCGAGGTSTGMAQACRELGVEVDLLAIVKEAAMRQAKKRDAL